jgi:hypothetical protein
MTGTPAAPATPATPPPNPEPTPQPRDPEKHHVPDPGEGKSEHPKQ